MSKPKLALIPSGYKSGKVYSILPNDASGDFDFTRQSIGTRVRKDGLIEEAKTVGSITNELLYSEEFTGLYWGTINTTITSNQELAPNGTNTADKLQRTSTSASYRQHSISKSSTAKKYTTSVYLKKGSHDYFALRTQGSYPSRVDIRFRFDTEQIYYATAVSNFTLYDYGVEVLANDWYRLHYTYETDTYNNINVSFSPRHSDGNIDSSDSGSTAHAFVWGAMVSEGALSDYIKTEGSQETKRVETFTDVPRLDWLNSNCPSLLLEPQRTNYCLNNTQLHLNSTLSSGATITLTGNYATAPNGTLTATRLQATGSGSNYAYLSMNGTNPTTDGSGGGYYRSSVYVKSNTGNTQNIILFAAGAPSPYTREVTTEWTRIEILGYRPANAKYTYIGYSSGADSDLDFLAWGGQTELVNSYASSLIYTGASAVTRLKDECINGGDSDLFDITEGTFFVDVTPYINTSSNHYISLNDGGSSDRFVFIFQSNGTQVRLFGVSATVNFLSHYQNITFNQRNKLAVTFKEDEFKFYLNGSLVHTDTSGSMPTGLNQLDFSENNGNRNFEGKVHDTRVYDRVLIEAEAIELTTL